MPTQTASRKANSKSSKKQKVLKEITESMITPEERQEMISEAAYYIAEQHGFDPTRDYLNWLEAESTVDAMLLSERKGEFAET